MSEQPSSNERCINWPCAMRKGHVGPCSTSPEQRSSKEQVAVHYESQERADRLDANVSLFALDKYASDTRPADIEFREVHELCKEIERLTHENARLQSIVTLRERATDEPPAGVKCTHCNGKGYNEPIYDEQDGWIDETPCETCNGSGRITTVEQYLKTLPANWHEDSSLETWFPITAEELKRLKDERASQPPSAGRALDREDLIIPATRYYMGRRTIGVTAHCYALARAWPDLSRNVQDIIRRDLEEEFRRDDAMRADEKCSRSYYPLGDDCDREAWEMVRAAWGAVTKETGYTWTPDAQGAVNGPPRERDCASDETSEGQS